MDDEAQLFRRQARQLRQMAEVCLASARTVLDDVNQPGDLTKAVDRYVKLADEVRRSISLAHKLEREALRLERAQAARAARPRPPRMRNGQLLH